MKSLRSVFAAILVCAALLGAGWLTVSQLGYKNLTVTSGSMEPLMWPGSRVVVQRDVAIKPNDIVAFHNPETGGTTTHIFGGYAADGHFKTRGMANDDPDNFTPAPTKADVIGKVVYHTEVFTSRFWYTPRGLGIVLLLASALLLMVICWTLGREQQQAASPSEKVAQPA
jgi:signal peptidase I